jgi:hypothetical protein
MAETDFYMVDEDLRRLAGFIFAEGGVIVPYIHFVRPVVETLDSVESLMDCRRETRCGHFAVLSDAWQKAPMEVGGFRGKTGSGYYVKQKSGGPVVDILVPAIYEREGKSYIPPGFIAYHGQFWNQVSSQMERPAPSLVKFYRRLCKMTQDGAARAVDGPRKYWVTRNALQELAGGALLGGSSTVSMVTDESKHKQG